MAVLLAANVHEYLRLARWPAQRLHLDRCPVRQLKPRPLLRHFAEPNILRLEPEHVLGRVRRHPEVGHKGSLDVPCASVPE